MKKAVAVFCLSMLVASNCWAQSLSHADITRAVDQTVLNKVLNSSANAKEKNITVEFQVRDWIAYDKDEDLQYSFRYTLGCKAYALHANWLIMAGTCAKPMPVSYKEYNVWPHGNKQELVGHDILPIDTKHVGLRINYNDHIMLLWRDDAAYSAPYVKVLATSSVDRLVNYLTNSTPFINTSRLGLNKVYERHFDKNSIKGNTFKLDEGLFDLSGTASDPLFLDAYDGQDYLVAYNNGIMDYKTFADGVRVWDGRKSDTWYALTEEDLQFIKKTVQANRPQDWEEVHSRLRFDWFQWGYNK